MLHWHDEQMFRRLWIRIGDRDHVFVTLNDLRWNLTGSDPAKNALVWHATLLAGGHGLGLRYSKAIWVSGLGTNPPMLDFTAIGTVVCTIGKAGTSS